MADNPGDGSFIELTANIVSAYVSNHSVPSADIPALITQVHSALKRVSGGATEIPVEPLKPAVPIKRSINSDYIVCLEDGKKLKMLKRYLRTRYGLTPESYRAKWNLPADYPMTAPNYAAKRSDFAKQIGLGKPSRKKRA